MELLTLFEQWTGHRMLSEKVTRPHVGANRPILIPSVPVSEGIEIRHGCQFLSSLVRVLSELPGGIGRFLHHLPPLLLFLLLVLLQFSTEEELDRAGVRCFGCSVRQHRC